jgi:tetratricopeptide (TPR) repeat protein
MTVSSPSVSKTGPLAGLPHSELLEGLSLRWPVPYCPEYEMASFRRVYRAQLREALGRLAAVRDPDGLALRGRVRRLSGDLVGARADLTAACAGGCPRGFLWFGEIDLGTLEGETRLARARKLAPMDPLPSLYLGASLLLRGRDFEARSALADAAAKGDSSCLRLMLLGLAQEGVKRGSGAATFRKAALRNPRCSAPHLLRARALLPDIKSAARACEDAFDVEPEYAHIAMCHYRAAGGWPGSLRKLLLLAFAPGRHESLSARFLALDLKILPDHFEGVKLAERSLKKYPRRSWSWGLLGRAYARCPPASGLQARAADALNRAVELAPDQGWPRAWRALGLVVSGRRAPRALADLNACLKLQPNYFWAYEWRGGLLGSLGRERAALRDLDTAVATNPNYPFALNRRSLVRRALGDFAGAALDLDEAFKLDSRYAWVSATGREPRAEELAAGIAELTRGLRRCPTLPSLRAWRGQLHLASGDYVAALRDFESGLALDPAHSLCLAWYGRALTLSGRPGDASRYLRRSVDLAPDRWLYRLWLGEALHQGGDARAALALIDGILAASPRRWQAWQARARILLSLDRAGEALADAARASSLDGRNADNHYLLAQALASKGRWREAEKKADLVLAISENYGRAWLLRAEVRRRRGKIAEAVADYRRALSSFPFLFSAEQRKAAVALVGAS